MFEEISHLDVIARALSASVLIFHLFGTYILFSLLKCGKAEIRHTLAINASLSIIFLELIDIPYLYYLNLPQRLKAITDCTGFVLYSFVNALALTFIDVDRVLFI